MLTEFGGIAFSQGHAAHLGLQSRRHARRSSRSSYAELLRAVRSLPLLAGFCYTQFTDTYQEANGLLYVDRTPKIPIEEIADATAGMSPSDRAGSTSPPPAPSSGWPAAGPAVPCLPRRSADVRRTSARRASAPGPPPGPCCSTR